MPHDNNHASAGMLDSPSVANPTMKWNPSAHPSGNIEKILLPHFERLRGFVIKPAKGYIKHPYCIPGGFYENQWDWDGYFISCHLAARKPARPEFMKYWVMNVLSARLPNGEFAACLSPEGARTGHSSLLLKPFLAQGAELYSRITGDDAWLKTHYDEISKIATRREQSHFSEKYGLFVWDDAMQSGADNNPAVSNDPALRRGIAACDVNAFYYREYRALTLMAGRLGMKEEEQRFRGIAQGIRSSVNQWLWNESEGSYFNLNLLTGEPIKRVSYSNFVPLWAGMAEQNQGQTMIRRYLWDPEHMLTPHGLRSLSLQDPEYNNRIMIIPYSNWQGPVWPIANYFYFVGLITYGFREEAASLVQRLSKLYLDDIDYCGSLHENYDAETGRPLAPSAEQSASGREGGFVGWNLLLQDMIEMLDGEPNLLKL